MKERNKQKKKRLFYSTGKLSVESTNIFLVFYFPTYSYMNYESNEKTGDKVFS